MNEKIQNPQEEKDTKPKVSEKFKAFFLSIGDEQTGITKCQLEPWFDEGVCSSKEYEQKLNDAIWKF